MKAYKLKITIESLQLEKLKDVFKLVCAHSTLVDLIFKETEVQLPLLLDKKKFLDFRFNARHFKKYYLPDSDFKIKIDSCLFYYFLTKCNIDSNTKLVIYANESNVMYLQNNYSTVKIPYQPSTYTKFTPDAPIFSYSCSIINYMFKIYFENLSTHTKLSFSKETVTLHLDLNKIVLLKTNLEEAMIDTSANRLFHYDLTFICKTNLFTITNNIIHILYKPTFPLAITFPIEGLGGVYAYVLSIEESDFLEPIKV